MRLYSSAGFWSAAQLWYTIFGLVTLAILGNALKDGFGEVIEIFQAMAFQSSLILAAWIAAGPIAHWLASNDDRCHWLRQWNVAPLSEW